MIQEHEFEKIIKKSGAEATIKLAILEAKIKCLKLNIEGDQETDEIFKAITRPGLKSYWEDIYA